MFKLDYPHFLIFIVQLALNIYSKNRTDIKIKMTFTESFFSRPKSIVLLGENNKKINLIVHGQGVFLFENHSS
jgi:hypothetical protein